MKNFFSSVVLKKGFMTIFFILIYIVGSRLTLPFVDLNSKDFLGGSTAYLAFSAALTGGNLRSLSLFSIGLSPWMSAMILWQMFSFSKKLGLNSTAIEIQDRQKMYLTLLIAVIQSLAISLSLPIQASYSSVLVILINTLLLIAGTFFLVWLSDLNASMGVGGSIVILLSSIIINIPQDVIETFKLVHIPTGIVVLLIFMTVIFSYLLSIMYRARYLVPVNKIGLHNRFKRYSYLDIQLNPAGGMPFMYAMSLVSIPQYFLMLLQVIFLNASWIQDWIGKFAIGRPVWLYTYIVVLFILGLAFSFVNMNGEEIAEKMKKSGEYIYNIYPGEETSRYINWLILRFAVIGSTYTVLMAGLPMLIVLYDPRYMQLTMLPGLFFIFNGMVFNIKEEIDALTLNENYRPLLEIDS